MASTNRVKTGMVGFLSATNSNTPELLVYRTYRDALYKEIIGDSCSSGLGVETLRRTNLSRWPVDYDPADLVSGFHPSCGYLPPTQCLDEFTAYSYAGTGGGTCSNYTLCNVRQTSNTCPQPWYSGTGFQKGTIASITNNTERYSLVTITNYSSRQPDHCLEVSGFEERRESLSDPYTTGQLIQRMTRDTQALLGRVDRWSCTGSSAFGLTEQELCGNMTLSKFRYKYFGPEGVEADIVIQWHYRVYYQSGVTTNWSVLTTNHVLCHGTVVVSDEVVLIPHYSAGVKRSYLSIELLSPASTACGFSSGFAQAQIDSVNGPWAAFGLGQCGQPSPAGFLYFHSGTPDAALGRAESLNAFVNACVAETIGENPIQQVRVPEGLVEVVDGEGEYDLNFYTDHGALDHTTGLYDIDSASLVASYNISLVSTTPVFRLRVSNPEGWYHEFAHSNGWWFLDRGDGLGPEGWHRVVDTSGHLLTNVHAILDGQGRALFSEIASFTLPAGRSEPQIQSQILGLGTDSMTNVWFYHTDPASDPINIGKPILTIDGYGGWERHQYDPITGRKSKSIRPVGNAWTNAPESACRVFEYAYTPFHALDDGHLEPGTPRVIREYVLGHLASMSGIALWPGHRLDVEYGWNEGRFPDVEDYLNPGNRLTWREQLSYANGQGSQTLAPDGTLTLHQVLTNRTGTLATNLLRVGAAYDQNPTLVQWDTLTSRLESLPDRRIHSVVTYHYQDGEPTLLIARETYAYFGPDGRSFTKTYLDGTSETQRASACCGLEEWVDRDGVTTAYHYDSRRRLVATVRLGIMTSNVLDQAGQVLETWRVPGQGPALRMHAFSYDTAGRLRSVTDALGRVTSHTFSLAPDGRSLHRVDHPDGSFSLHYYHRDGTLEREVGTALFPARYVHSFDTARGGESSQEIKLDAQGNDTPETTVTIRDWFGRTIASGQNQDALSLTRFPSASRQIQSDPDGVRTILETFPSGYWVGTDLDRNDSLDGTVDRRLGIRHDYHPKSGAGMVRRTIIHQWNDDGSEIGVATNEVSIDGLRSWQSSFDGVRFGETVYGSDGTRTHIQTAADGSYAISKFRHGLLVSWEHFTSNDLRIAQASFGYDQHGRQNTVTHESTGMATTLLYDLADQVVSNIVSAPGQPDHVTVYAYDQAGRLAATMLPDGTSLFHDYDHTGLLRKSWGSRTLPVEFTYDAQGRLKTMKTWRDFSSGSGAAVTTWSYDGTSGLLTNKHYPDGTSVGYTYTSGGRLKTRTWARGKPPIITTYHYGFDDSQPSNEHGDLVGITYANDPLSTPDVALVYNRCGRPIVITQGTLITTRRYNDAGQLLAEHYQGGPLHGLGVTNRYDGLLRRTYLAVSTASEPWIQRATYDAASRLATVTQNDFSAAYSYVANSSLVGQIQFRHQDSLRMTIAQQYDALNRLTRTVSSLESPDPNPVAFAHDYNQAGQRIRTTREDETFWTYSYNPLGQVTSARKYWPDRTGGRPVAGQQFQYAFDDLGNRRGAASGGNPWGSGLRYKNYSVNQLNQYTARTLPGAVQVLGEADAQATVTVNLYPANRQGEYFRAEIPVDNSGGAVWLSLTNLAVLHNGPDLTNLIEGSMFVPQSPEPFLYDEDGNLVEDGRWHYAWDAENRCVSAETTPAAAQAGVPRQKLEFAYDWLGRRISKTVSNWTGSAWVLGYQRKFLYDTELDLQTSHGEGELGPPSTLSVGGGNLIAELDGHDQGVRSFVWGVDLSGTAAGAAGMGGLLFVTGTGQDGTMAVCDDGFGNVSTLVDASDGRRVAQYEYGPFGEVLRASGPGANANPFRFATKYADPETSLVLFPLRPYSPSTGRFLCRDPMGEAGGWNLYALAANDPLNFIDPFGDDFIAVSDRPVKGTLGLFYHYSVQYWISCDDIELHTEYDIQNWLKSNVAKKRASTELLRDDGWKVWRWYRGRRWKLEDVSISVIHYRDQGTKFAAIYKGTPQEVKQQWDKILQQARGYRYAEQIGFNGSFKNWPNSRYDVGDDVNNSNTYIRDIVAKAGLTMQELAGSHPGRNTPQPNPDVYRGQVPAKGSTPPRPHPPRPGR